MHFDDSISFVNPELLHHILLENQSSLAFTREYEHLLGILSPSQNTHLHLSYFSMPHPSGIAVHPNGDISVISTRTPHLLYKFQKSTLGDKALYLPRIIHILPGSLYAHELYYSSLRQNLIVNITGYNEISAIALDSSRAHCMPFYRPAQLVEKTANCMQINSFSESAADIFAFTCFSFKQSRYKPWKDDNGPTGLGALIEVVHGSENKLVTGLTCPHSARYRNDDIYYCNSGFGTLSKYSRSDNKTYDLLEFASFTRGLAFIGKYIVVGLSKVLPNKPKYAPGLDPSCSHCGLAFVDSSTMTEVASVIWKNGMQIFDIQVVHNKSLEQFCFPQSRSADDLEPSPDFYSF